MSWFKNKKKKTEIDENSLFDGDDQLFKKIVPSIKCYAEYGCGKSTIWVANNSKALIYSIDTSQEWITSVRSEIGNREAVLKWIDCGELRDWGTPLTYEKRASFLRYAKSVWLDNFNPDTVLIDGRFRVLCFLNSLKYADEGTRIIFDDYIDRPHYHIVEEFVSRSEVCGRQCLFVVPPREDIDLALVDSMIEKFEYVMV